MSTVEERVLLKEMAVNTGATLPTVIERCLEVYENADLSPPVERDEIANVIGQVLEVVSHEYHLVPKVTVDLEGAFIENPAPENAITQSLAELWTTVSN